MNWKINYSRKADKFAQQHGLYEHIENKIVDFLKAYEKGSKLLDVVRLKGFWKGYFRIRIGDTRVIFDLNPTDKVIYIETIDTRGDVYKKK